MRTPADGTMSKDDPLPDPETPEWPIAWAAKEVLRRHLGPKFDRRLPSFLATAIVERMRLARWLIIKRPPDPPHSTPGESAARRPDSIVSAHHDTTANATFPIVRGTTE